MLINPNKVQSQFPTHPSNYQSLLIKYRKIKPFKISLKTKAYFEARQVKSGLERYNGPWETTQRLHLLRRCLFGIRKADLALVENMNLEETLTLLFQQQSIEPPINDYDGIDGIVDVDAPFGTTWINAKHGDDLEGPRTVSLKSWLIKNMIKQPTSLEEKMILFWHDLLPIKTWDIFFGKFSYHYFEMLRENAFGNFKTLIKALTLDQAMLLFLNGFANNKEAPDENYARELQELFCIGKGPDSKFSEEDVRAAARVLTGWLIQWEDLEKEGYSGSYFLPAYHDTGDKQFSDFYKNTVIKGRVGEEGANELDDLLDMIFDNQEVSKYICRRIYQFFVYHQIDENAENNVIVPLAKIFRDSNFEIKPVMEALLSSEHFYDSQNIGAMIKSPPDFVLGLWRTLEVEGVDKEDLNLNFHQHQSLLWNMANLGMEIGDPPSVSGWPAYYQAPTFDKYWITTDTIANRAIFGDSLLYWGAWIKEGLTVNADLIRFLDSLDNPFDPNAMLREAASLLLGMPLEDEAFHHLKSILLTGQETDGYWTSAWGDLKNDPENMEYKLVVENRLKSTFQHMLQLGEAQLM